VIDPSEILGKVDQPLLKVSEFKAIFNELCLDFTQNFIDKNFGAISLEQTEIVSEMLELIGYYVLDEQVQALIKQAKKNLHVDILTKSSDLTVTAQSISIYLALYKHFETEYDQEIQEVVTQWIIANF
jgi:hypothetical protein